MNNTIRNINKDWILEQLVQKKTFAFKKLYLYVEDISEPKYEFLAKYFYEQARKEHKDVDDVVIIGDWDQIIQLHELTGNDNLIIFDNWQHSKEVCEKIGEHLAKFDKEGVCSYIVASRFTRHLPETVKSNCDYHLKFKRAE